LRPQHRFFDRLPKLVETSATTASDDPQSHHYARLLHPFSGHLSVDTQLNADSVAKR